MQTLYGRLVLFLLLAFVAGSCATPIGPTGGEPDRTGPVVIDTSPPTGTTNFDGDRVRFRFDKYINRNSVRQNVSIEPDLALDFDVNFGRKSATVVFNDPLPENTTIVIQLGTDVTDTQNNKMAGTFDLALSTGDVLDDGRVAARVLEAKTGEAESGLRVYLYREPVNFSERAMYMAETDTSGAIQFGYLSEGTYRAIWLNDLNRNRIWEPERERAQPFAVENFELGHGEEIDLGTLYVSIPDTVAPQIDGVGLLSERRLRLRLSEPVQWDYDSVFFVTDTLHNEITRAFPLYTDEADPNILFAQSEASLSEGQFYTLVPQGITDYSRNPLQVNFSPFQGSSEPDTTNLTTISHNAGSGLFPNEPLEISYSRFIDEDAVVDSLLVLEGDRMISDWEHVELDRHILRIFPRERWESGLRYQFRVWNPWELEREQIEPDFWQSNQLGSIEITLENSDSEYLNILTLTDRDESILVDTTFTDTIRVDNLPPLEYKAIVFQDVNGNGVWDPGSVYPYEKPEPYIIRRSIPVREGFTSEAELRYPGKIEIRSVEEESDSVEEAEEDENAWENG